MDIQAQYATAGSMNEPAQIRVLPADEQAKMLEARYQEAQEHVTEGERLVREWTPVADSCRAGLDALAKDPSDGVPERR